jgi:hypothetical protein
MGLARKRARKARFKQMDCCWRVMEIFLEVAVFYAALTPLQCQ